MNRRHQGSARSFVADAVPIIHPARQLFGTGASPHSPRTARQTRTPTSLSPKVWAASRGRAERDISTGIKKRIMTTVSFGEMRGLRFCARHALLTNDRRVVKGLGNRRTRPPAAHVHQRTASSTVRCSRCRNADTAGTPESRD